MDLIERLRAVAESDMVPMDRAMQLMLEAAAALEAAREDATAPDRIVLWSRGVSPNWYFIAEKSGRSDMEGLPVYETLDEIVLRGSPEAAIDQVRGKGAA